MAELVAAEPLLLRADQAEPRYNEALQTAVAACAADTAGQTCYICYGEGDEERARNAQVLVPRGERLRARVVLGTSGPGRGRAWRWARLERWDTCGLCEQGYYGDVACALGWACWKTCVGRPEADPVRRFAMSDA